MSTTALDVDSRERAPPSEQGVLDLAQYTLKQVRRDTEFVLFRGLRSGHAEGSPSSILVQVPVADPPSPATVRSLQEDYALRSELDPAYVVRSLSMVQDHGRPMVILEDPLGTPLDLLLNGAMDIAQFLRLAIRAAAALGHVHSRGLVHKDIKPANILVNVALTQAWLMGLGMASRLTRERQSGQLPEYLVGTLAYMAPEQTGRMNRSIDSRSDLYSLGVTFYEMLTGNLPFTSSDPMELVHCHVARQPTPPCENVSGVPRAVSAIVMKLLAKMAEERYQTAAGVESDLQRCLTEWETQHRIDEFSLGEHDTPDRLLIPEKLYGREPEIDALLAAFDRVVAVGKPELVLVSGYSGIGKSSVVNEFLKSLVPPRGLFASGKFDQYKRDIPYATLAQAFQSLVKRLLGKSEAELAFWRDALRDALGPNGRLIIELVPELELIIGHQAPAPDLPPHDARRRFQLIFGRFIGVFGRPEHPLVLFLDDLQWLDTATLDILTHLVTHAEVQHLLLVGAYRDNEVTSSHPLMRTLESIRRADARMHEIKLEPLGLDDIGQLTEEALHCDRQRACSLARLVHEKTGGNPFFAIQFFMALAEEGLFAFDPIARAWQCDIDHIRSRSYTDNVADLVAKKLKRLSATTQGALKQLACLGNVADTAILSLVRAETDEETDAALSDAVHAGLVFRLENTYKFLHDRIQQAAYSLIPEEHRAEVHLKIGRALLARLTPDQLAEHLFDVANQLNRGAAVLAVRDEKTQVAIIGLRAGRKAKASAAFASACLYLEAGTAPLDERDWEDHHDLMFNLWIERAECEFLIGHLDKAEQLLAELLQRATTRIHEAAVYHLKVGLHEVKGEYPQAVISVFECLNLFDIDIPAHPTQEQVQAEYETVWQTLNGRPIESLIGLPLMTDPEVRAATQLLSALLGPAYFTDFHLFCLLVCRMVKIGMQHGTSGASTHAYGYFGTILGPVFHRYCDAPRFARLVGDLVDKHGFIAYYAKVRYAMGTVAFWTQPISAAIDFMRATVRTAIELGDLTFACYGMFQTVTGLLLRNDPLEAVWRESEKALDFVQHSNYRDAADIIRNQQRFVATMQGRSASFSTFSDSQFCEATFESELTGDRMAMMICWYWSLKLQARFLSGDYAEALAAADQVKPLLWASAGQIQPLVYFYYAALSVAALYENASVEQQKAWRDLLIAHQEQLREWTESYPPTFADKHALVSAEIARLEGRDLDAMRLYEQAIQSARENGFIQNEGLAHEVAARFYAARGFEAFCHLYLQNARSCYLRWGAHGKVRHLDLKYPHLTPPLAPLGSDRTTGAPVEQLELATVLKVSQAVSGEMNLDRLLERLMRAAIEHAGAERGLLIARRGDDLQIQAQATASGADVTVDLRDSDHTEAALPQSLVRYVMRTQDPVILEDAASQNLFSDDPYLVLYRARSILCLPLISQGNLMGVLYLENNLAPRVFAPARIAVLKLLASQAAMSLENTRLYRDLAKREAKIRRLVDANIFGIFIWDLDGTIVDANDAFLRVLGYEREDLVAGRLRWTDLTAAQWGGRDRQELLAEIQRTGSLQPFEWEHVRKDGSRVPVMAGAASFDGENQGVAFVLDLTERKRAEQALRQSEAYLAQSQRLTHTGSWASDPSAAKVVYWSDEMFRIYGRDPRLESLPTHDELLRYVHPDDRDCYNKATERERGRYKAEMTIDFRIVKADGTVRHLHSTRLPVLDKTGVLIGTLVDVTERRHAEQRLLVQYRVTRILADAATVGEATPKVLQAMCECLGWDLGAAWRVDPKARVLRCAELWRTSSDEAAQFEVVTRMSTFRSGSGLPGRVWETGEPAYIPDVGQDAAFPRVDIAACQVLRAAIAFPILLGRDVIGVIGFISRDVSQPDQELLGVLASIGSQIGQFTKRTAAVDELQLRVNMLQNIPVAAWSVTPDGTPDIVNQLWYEYTGQTPEYINSHPEAWMTTLHPEDRESASRSYWDGIRSGRGFTMEARFLRARDGTYRWHLNRAVPVRDAEGNIVRMVGTSTDVHDWRQAQEALRNTQTEFAHMTRVMTMGELTASIAHEVNQPLGAMVTSAAACARWLATKPPQMDKARRALERIANDGKRAAEVIRRIRALMKRQAPRKEWLDINETILEVIALAQYQLRRSAILLETRLGHHLPSVRGDRVQLQQVLLNLIINAIEAMSGIKERPRKLTIVSASDGPDAISVEVRDAGTGLDPEHVPHLFEPFYTTKAEGLGIGLSISCSILEAHGGRLSAAANEPHGTVFLFSLPVNEISS